MITAEEGQDSSITALKRVFLRGNVPPPLHNYSLQSTVTFYCKKTPIHIYQRSKRQKKTNEQGAIFAVLKCR